MPSPGRRSVARGHLDANWLAHRELCRDHVVTAQTRPSRPCRPAEEGAEAMIPDVPEKEPRPTGRSESPRRPHRLQLLERTVQGPLIVVRQFRILKLPWRSPSKNSVTHRMIQSSHWSAVPSRVDRFDRPNLQAVLQSDANVLRSAHVNATHTKDDSSSLRGASTGSAAPGSTSREVQQEAPPLKQCEHHQRRRMQHHAGPSLLKSHRKTHSLRDLNDDCG